MMREIRGNDVHGALNMEQCNSIWERRVHQIISKHSEPFQMEKPEVD